MLQSFKRSGGLSQAQDVADLMASRHGQDVGTLAKWIVKGDLVHFDWRHETWLPMFQFDLSTMTPSTNVGRVLREFAGVLDAWEIAHWFARPCVALEGRTPAESLATDPDGVLQAARCDRFLIDA